MKTGQKATGGLALPASALKAVRSQRLWKPDLDPPFLLPPLFGQVAAHGHFFPGAHGFVSGDIADVEGRGITVRFRNSAVDQPLQSK